MRRQRLLSGFAGFLVLAAGFTPKAKSDDLETIGFSRGLTLLQDHLKKLARFETSLEDMILKNRQGERVELTSIKELDLRFERDAIHSIESELHDIYRIEILINRLKGWDGEMAAKKIEDQETLPSPEPAPEMDLVQIPVPEKPQDDKPVTPTLPADVVKLGDSYQALGDFEKALALYRTLEDREKRPRVLYQMALCLERLEKYEAAATTYEQLTRAFGETYWGKQAEWARNYVRWKGTLGDLEKNSKASDSRK